MSAQKARIVLEKIRALNPKATLVAATKYADAGQINEILEEGVSAVGENRVQDAEEKFPALLPCERHYLGRIQSNKIGKIVDLFDVVQTLCEVRHAKKMDVAAKTAGKTLRVLVQVNAGAEGQKQGLAMEEKTVRDFLVLVKGLGSLKLEGLMVVVPQGQGPFYFREAKALFDSLSADFSLRVLSMGTSGDYQEAIKNGATSVRVGRALF